MDVKNFSQAKQIRDTLITKGLFSYITSSRSKGYHIYLFAQEVFTAKDIRLILQHTLDTLQIKAEVFPKQDTLSVDVPLGNYLNLPVYGDTRTFLSGDLKEVPLELAIKRIKRIPNETIIEVLKGIPSTEEPPRKTKRSEKRETVRHPACIDSILQGVGEGQRDDAAFALTRYYLNELKYPASDTFTILQKWDERNRPPLGEQTLDIKVKSAEKKYSFGCGSIRDKATLKEFCIGEENCEWWKEVAKKKELYDNLPTIKANNRYLKEKTKDTIAAVVIANNPPKIFERSGHMVRIEHDEDMVPFIEQLSESAFRGFIERSANFFVTRKQKEEYYDVPVDPPMEIVKDIMSLPERNLPPLLSLTEIPILRSDGSILKEPGYDPITKIYYLPAADLKF